MDTILFLESIVRFDSLRVTEFRTWGGAMEIELSGKRLAACSMSVYEGRLQRRKSPNVHYNPASNLHPSRQPCLDLNFSPRILFAVRQCSPREV